MSDQSTITSVSLGRGPVAPRAHRRTQLVVLALADAPGLASSSHGLDQLDEVRFGRGPRAAERVTEAGRRVLTLRIPDGRMSSDHGRLLRGPDGWVLDDPASKNGAVVDGTLVRRRRLHDGALIELGHTFFMFRDGGLDVAVPPRLTGDTTAAELGLAAPALATFASSLAARFDALERVATTTVSVVLLGETGTGKEVVARALHDLSGRPGPFVAVNCGALPANLVESELFGHRRGAFSGAVADRPGRVRSADHGTLFLDEIGELPVAAQAAFLRVLQEHEVVPVGDERAIKVDTRLCAATLRDLEALAERGEFRKDLYARLFGLVIELPPLRARREDLGMLLDTLIRRHTGDAPPGFTPAAMRALFRHHWPLNIRELEKVLAAALALAGGATIELHHLPASIQHGPRVARADEPGRGDDELDDDGPDDDDGAGEGGDDAGEPPTDDVHGRLLDLLTVHRGNVRQVSQAMGVRRTQVYRWIKRFAIDLDRFRA